MAKATATTIVTTYNLELSKEEAEAIVDIIICVGGDPNGRRRYIDSVSDALNKAGISWEYRGGTSHAERVTISNGQIEFKK